MVEQHMYLKIAESIRKDILNGTFKVGEKIPSVRAMSVLWGCTQGTVQRAFQVLAQQGLLDSRAGKGTIVSGKLTPIQQKENVVLRRANLVNRSEAYVLEALSQGFSIEEIQNSFYLAIDRWKIFDIQDKVEKIKTISYVGSHDPLINALTSRFTKYFPGYGIKVSFSGSTNGLYALKNNQADFTGCHIWHAESNTYNLEAVKEIFKNEKMVLLTLAHRRLGLILPPGNPQRIKAITDLVRKGVRFGNRQQGSGTRIWLDHMLTRNGISPDQLAGYDLEFKTHSEIGRAVAEGSIGAGLGLESVAATYGLDFVFLSLEKFDLVFRQNREKEQLFKRIMEWLKGPSSRKFIGQFPGYETSETGKVIYSL